MSQRGTMNQSEPTSSRLGPPALTQSSGKRRTGLIVALIACALGGGSVGLYMLNRSPVTPANGQGVILKVSDDAALTTADKAVVRKMPFEIVTTANGELEARNKIEIRNPLDQSSTIVRIVPEGTRVKKGEVVIQLNVEEIQLKVDDERLRVESARAQYAVAENNFKIQQKDNESQLRQAQLKVELAELALRQWEQGDLIKKRRELELDVDKAELELSRLANVYVRSQELFDQKFLSRDQMDRDEVSYIEAISNYKITRLTQDVYDNYEVLKERKQFESDLAESKEELVKAELNSSSELASKLAEVNNSREQLAGLERKLAKLTKQRDDATITAEQDGLVVYATSLDRGGGRGGNDTGTLQIGTQVFPNQLLMILPDTREMVAAVRVHESLAGRIRPGQEVTIRIDAAGGSVYSGSVQNVGVMAESGGWRDPNLREYTVRVALETAGNPNLKPAMRCEARIVLDNVPETTVAPVQSVFIEGPVQYVYVPAGVRDKFVKQPVRVGKRSDTMVEISKGLNVGDIVLVREPSTGEVLGSGFTKEQLLATGYRLDEEGRVMAEGGFIRPTGGAAPQGGGRSADSGESGSAPRRAGGGRGSDSKQDSKASTPSEISDAGKTPQLDKPASSAESVPATSVAKPQDPTTPAAATPVTENAAPEKATTPTNREPVAENAQGAAAGNQGVKPAL